MTQIPRHCLFIEDGQTCSGSLSFLAALLKIIASKSEIIQLETDILNTKEN
jgi:hypothetical protein